MSLLLLPQAGGPSSGIGRGRVSQRKESPTAPHPPGALGTAGSPPTMPAPTPATMDRFSAAEPRAPASSAGPSPSPSFRDSRGSAAAAAGGQAAQPPTRANMRWAQAGQQVQKQKEKRSSRWGGTRTHSCWCWW